MSAITSGTGPAAPASACDRSNLQRRVHAGLNVGTAARASRRQTRRDASMELLRDQERERRMLAIHLHDNIGQNLAAAQIRLETLLADGAVSAQASEALEAVRELLGQAITQTRSLTFDLSPSVLYEAGLEQAVRWLGDRMVRLHQLPVEVRSDGSWPHLDEEAAVTVFRAIREALMNVVKHARASCAKVELRSRNGTFHASVEDNGIGMRTASGSSAGVGESGFGLFSIRQALQRLGGRLTARPALNAGTRVEIEIPLRATT